MAFFVFKVYITRSASPREERPSIMNFKDTLKIEGHLQIVKIEQGANGSWEEVLHDDSNVITGGLGRSMTQFMTTSGCDEEICGITQNVPSGCHMWHYQISRYQVGQGASAVSATSAVVNLGLPLTDPEYGGVLRSVKIEPDAWLWSDFEAPIAKQDFGIINQQGTLVSSLVSVWSFDEETANGTTLNEAGLFVENPYLYRKEGELRGTTDGPITMVGGTFFGSGDQTDTDIHKGAHLLAAYNQFEPIRKEKYFSLLFRWTINFSIENI